MRVSAITEVLIGTDPPSITLTFTTGRGDAKLTLPIEEVNSAIRAIRDDRELTILFSPAAVPLIVACMAVADVATPRE